MAKRTRKELIEDAQKEFRVGGIDLNNREKERALKALEIAKKQECDKFLDGYRYVKGSDGIRRLQKKEE